MSKHVGICPTEAADRLVIRELIEAHAHIVKQDSVWLSAERLLYVAWVQEPALA
jgi:hypothetical protein